jgi:hypothetical protein
MAARMGFFNRARKMLAADDEVAERQDRDALWGRIVGVKSDLRVAVTVEVEIHVGDLAPETTTITTTPTRKRKPEVGEDVAIALREGDQTVGHLYTIKWDEAPHYGIPTPTQQQLQDAVAPGLLTDDPTAKPPGLEDAERMRDAGEVSEQAFQTMKANILGPGERLRQLHDSGQMSDEIYAKALENQRRFAAGARIGDIPNIEQATANLTHAMDDAGELDLQRRGALASATVVELPAPVPDDRFSMRMTLDVKPPDDGSPYRVDCTFPAARPIDALSVGTILPIKIDPDDRARVAVIWNRWLADSRSGETKPPIGAEPPGSCYAPK